MIKKRYSIIGLTAFLLLILIYFLYVKDSGVEESGIGSDEEPYTAMTAEYVGRDSCITCHQKEHRLWEGSDHDLAMQPANEHTVLGDFSGITFTHMGVTSKFYRRGSGYYVYTEGPAGKMMEFEVQYTFGIVPLQQYLIPFPGGKLQVLPLCWDTRPISQGGQRWFHIYPDEQITPDDMLHWTHFSQNWNYMCSECHSTNVRKNYIAEIDSFQTTYSEIDVSCEACHGPGSRHIEWARIKESGEETADIKGTGLQISFPGREEVTWVFSDTSATAHRTTPKKDDRLIEMCARCHARRSQLTDAYVFGESLLNTHRPAFLVDGLYFPDGQILEEVYVWGSFLQSRMYQQGVLCNDCHESHSMRVYARDNTLCYRCHKYETYGVRGHHFHNPDSTGASCVECHMPERTYMVVDPRRDHSMRIPRPDLTIDLGSPNACNKCHKDKDAGWARAAVRKWYGPDIENRPQYGRVFAAARRHDTAAFNGLATLLTDAEKPAIVRATAAVELGNYLNREVVRLLHDVTHDRIPLMRYAALNALAGAPPDLRLSAARHLLDDPVRLIRTEAARLLIDIQSDILTGSERDAFESASREYLAIQYFNADQPAAQLNLGVYFVHQGNYRKAENAYLRAIDQEPGLAFAYINLADLYRLQNRDDEGIKLLETAIEKIPGNTDLYYALSLVYIRKKLPRNAVSALELATRLNPDNAQMQYALALAYDAAGDRSKAIKSLVKSRDKFPADVNILYALTTFYRDQGDFAQALEHARRLLETDGNNPNYQQLVAQLESLIESESPE